MTSADTTSGSAACDSPSSNFTEYKEKYLDGYDYKILKITTLEECLNRCLTATFTCLTVDYLFDAAMPCRLSEETAITCQFRSRLRSTTDFYSEGIETRSSLYHRRIEFDGVQFTNACDNLADTFTEYPEKYIQGYDYDNQDIPLDDCLAQCVLSPSYFTCVTVDYDQIASPFCMLSPFTAAEVGADFVDRPAPTYSISHYQRTCL
nr:hypothetical protein BaRGS_014471 [Batillaria attramentaria]